MKPAIYLCLLTTILISTVSCQMENKEKAPATPVPDSTSKEKPIVDLDLHETSNQEDTARDNFPAEKLRPIRENFKRINTISKWSDTLTRELSATTDGGEARFYRNDGKLEKITAQQFGETFHQLTEYYLLNGQLSFVYDRAYRYNRPMYYDSAAMKQNKDTETFDPAKAILVETRSYFENGKLIHQIQHNENNDTPADTRSTEEQKRLLEEFQSLQKLLKENESLPNPRF